MKIKNKDKLIKELLVLLILQNNKFDAFQFDAPRKIKKPSRYNILVEEELTKMKMMDLDNPAAHIDQFVKDNIDKQKNKKSF